IIGLWDESLNGHHIMNNPEIYGHSKEQDELESIREISGIIDDNNNKGKGIAKIVEVDKTSEVNKMAKEHQCIVINKMMIAKNLQTNEILQNEINNK
ncbi:11677_t:CDS:2, partial [Entrophospora sp. SA101]